MPDQLSIQYIQQVFELAHQHNVSKLSLGLFSFEFGASQTVSQPVEPSTQELEEQMPSDDQLLFGSSGFVPGDE